MTRLGRPLFVLGALLGAGAVANAGGVATAGMTRATAGLRNATVVTIGRTPEGRAIPPSFVGVSLEYRTLLSAERPGTGSDPVLAQLIRNLAPGQTPIVRIGGDSTDWTWWPARGLPPPPGGQLPPVSDVDLTRACPRQFDRRPSDPWHQPRVRQPASRGR